MMMALMAMALLLNDFVWKEINNVDPSSWHSAFISYLAHCATNSSTQYSA